MTATKTKPIFANSAGVLLLAMASALILINLTGPVHLVQPRDPIFGISIRSMFWIMSGMALIIALMCLFCCQLAHSMPWVACFASVYLICRIGFYWAGVRSFTGYLESFSYAFRISSATASTLADLVFAYLLIGSLVLLAWLKLRKIRRTILNPFDNHISTSGPTSSEEVCRVMVGGLELTVALICHFGKQAGLQIGCLAWLATDFVEYRIGVLWEYCQPQVACIGSLSDPLHLTNGIADAIIGFLPFYLLLGSGTSLIWYWREGTKQTRVTLKMFCPSCGGKIRFSIRNLCRTITCPLCKTTLTLRTPEKLKMSCSFCKDHTEFPAFAIGQKIFCLHRNMTVILREPA